DCCPCPAGAVRCRFACC
uniref:Turripeptide ubi3a n=1 Tax=Unedogemmula bisaya TaxID=746885 RepID=TU3A_UNEBI|nr:RecName: Full=Turripeptide ubi3a [Unedogemmula bisaya]